MELRINSIKVRNALIFGLLFLAAMNFAAKFFYFAFLAFAVLLLTQRPFRLNIASLLYLWLGFVMAAYNSGEGVLSMLRCLSYGSLYLLGFNICFLPERHSPGMQADGVRIAQGIGFALVVTVCFGSFAHYLLNAAVNFNSSVGRNTVDVWSGETMAATGQAALVCLMLGLAVSMIYLPKQRLHRYVGIACIVGILAYNLVLANRATIVALAILLVVAYVLVDKVDRTYTQKYRIGLGLLLAFVLCAIAFWQDFGGVQTRFFDSNLFNRFEGSSIFLTSTSTRTEAKILYITEGWRYPLGGMNLRNEYGYAHDLFLDGYDEYGIFGLLLLLAIVAHGVRGLYRFLRRTSYGGWMKLAVVCVYCSILLEFCIEPILAGMAWLFVCYCLINGCLSGMNYAYYASKKRDVV